MACIRGRVTPNAQTKLRLFSDAAGHCNRPECRQPLFSETGEPDYHIAEMAHIIAASDLGPRAIPEVDRTDRSSYDNLILLCPNCHTMVDKCPKRFSDKTLREWKFNHKSLIYSAIGVQTVSSRSEGLRFVEPLLRANQMIHNRYGPDNEYRHNPEAEEADIWKRKMVCQIIPNSQKILLFLDRNIELLHDGELVVVERFRQHVDDLVGRHLNDSRTVASRFPLGMDTLFH